MKRRTFVRALAAVPVAAPLAAQQPPANQSAPGIPVNPAQGIQPPARAAEELPKLEIATAESAADPMPRFFTSAQLSALRRVSDLLMPAANGSPGALVAGAPEFLDFLVGASGPERKTVYRSGLDGLNAQAMRQFSKPFADIDGAQADTLMAPLRVSWTYDEPADPVARFLRVAKADVRTATVNSRPSAAAGRRFAGSGLYWYPLD